MHQRWDYQNAGNAWKDIIVLKISRLTTVFLAQKGTTVLMEQRILMTTHAALGRTTACSEGRKKRIASHVHPVTTVLNGVRDFSINNPS